MMANFYLACSRFLLLTAFTMTPFVLRSAGVAWAQNAPPAVGLWERFEFSVSNPTSYADPYRDVTLEVTYRAPDGTLRRFWGFYDGGHTWKGRFMPDQLGKWSYEARFSDGKPATSGDFECVPSTVPGMLDVYQANPIWFGYRGGGAVFVRSFHVGDRFFAANWPEAKRREFLDWAQAQGYNMLSIASHYLNRDVEGRGRGWATPRLWPLDAAEYRKMESILDDLARRRILVYPFAGFFGRDSKYPRDPADQELYVRYTLARLGSYWNILLNVAGPEPNVKKVWMEPADVIRIGRLIRKLDIFSHPLSVHNRTGNDPYRDADWTTYGTIQGPKTVNRRLLNKGLLESHHPAKPLFAQETLWSGNSYHREPYSDDDLRKNTIVIHMSGAVLNFGDMNGNSSSGFSGSMDLADRKQDRHDIVRRAWDLLEALPFANLKPRQDLVDNGYCLAEPGVHYLVYLESPGTVSVKVTGGPFQVKWINARNAADVRTAAPTADGKRLATPIGGDDWILHLYR